MDAAIVLINNKGVIDHSITSKLNLISEKLITIGFNVTLQVKSESYHNLCHVIKSFLKPHELILMIDNRDEKFPYFIDKTLTSLVSHYTIHELVNEEHKIMGKFYENPTKIYNLLTLSTQDTANEIDEILQWSQRHLKLANNDEQQVVNFFGITKDQILQFLNQRSDKERFKFELVYGSQNDSLILNGPKIITSEVVKDFKESFKDHIFSTANTMISLPNSIMQTLQKLQKTLAIASNFVGVPMGNSMMEYSSFKGLIVAPTDDIKEHVLGIPYQILSAHGNKSKSTAQWMAHQVKQIFNSDIGLSIIKNNCDHMFWISIFIDDDHLQTLKLPMTEDIIQETGKSAILNAFWLVKKYI